MQKSIVSSRSTWVLALILLCFPLLIVAGETNEARTATKTGLAPLIAQLSNRFLEEKLTVAGLENELAAAAEQSANKQSWYIGGDKYQVRVTAEAGTKDSNLTELKVYPNNTAQLELKDLEKIFGASRVFVRSKNTWVKFEPKKIKKNKPVAIVAELYAPPESKSSPVLMLKLRMD